MFSILRCKISEKILFIQVNAIIFHKILQICKYFCTFAADFVNMNAKILIIDGDISLSTVLSDYFRSRGYESHAVGSGQEGLDFLSKTVWIFSRKRTRLLF